MLRVPVGLQVILVEVAVGSMYLISHMPAWTKDRGEEGWEIRGSAVCE